MPLANTAAAATQAALLAAAASYAFWPTGGGTGGEVVISEIKPWAQLHNTDLGSTPGLKAFCGPLDAIHTTEGTPAQGLHIIQRYSTRSDPRADGPGGGATPHGWDMVSAYVFVDAVNSAEPPALEMPEDSPSLKDWFTSMRAIVDQKRPTLHRRLQKELEAFPELSMSEYNPKGDEMAEPVPGGGLNNDTLQVVISELKSNQLRFDPPQWRAFSPYGTPLRTVADVVNALDECGAVYVFEGGSFMWPGVSIGCLLRVIPF